ncbi:hypothetical protein GY45DRAFT_1042482 [Cubamyces sp. BRFM 1775]|nr:hypothetical protein GY45DRAFT_1042482 [Cubamyces sp. BRFM 1775]
MGAPALRSCLSSLRGRRSLPAKVLANATLHLMIESVCASLCARPSRNAQCQCSVWDFNGCCCCSCSIRTVVPRAAGPSKFSVPRPFGSGSHDRASLSLEQGIVSLRS